MITVHVHEMAARRGYKNAHQLARAMEVPDNLAVRVWKGAFERIDRKTLDKLCRVLRCQPGQLLKYAPGENYD